jgi:predicted RNA binding protein YcfA (HicA-like mRNA interferase family)
MVVIVNSITQPNPVLVTVSGKLNVEVPVGTLNSALRQAGLKK